MLIYDYYLQEVGQKEIARRLNRLGRKTPAQLRAERHGREFCSSYRIREEYLDAQLVKHAESLRESWAKEQADLQRLYKHWSLRQPAQDREIAQLWEEIRQHEEDIDELLMMRIQSVK